MDETTATTDTTAPTAASESAVTEGAEQVEELLVEEISIDGMCGVY